MEIGEEILEYHDYHGMAEPQELIETLIKKESHKRKPTRSFWEEGYICRIQWYIKGLPNILPRIQEYIH